MRRYRRASRRERDPPGRSDGAPYQGVLIRLQNVKLTALGADPICTANPSSGGATFQVDDDDFRSWNADKAPARPVTLLVHRYLAYDPSAPGACSTRGQCERAEATLAADQTDCCD